MSIRTCAIVMFLVVLAACESKQGNLPVALAKEGTVCNTSGKAGADHLHDLAGWKVKAGMSKVALKQRQSGAPYIEVVDDLTSELRNADFLVINESSNPVRSVEAYLDECKENVEPTAFTTDLNVPDFVFAFSIAQVKNGPDAVDMASPHAIVYLPINIGQLPTSEAQEFQILMFHMESKKEDCPDTAGEDRDQCVALVELRTLWEQGVSSEVEKKQAVAARIRPMLKVNAPIPAQLRARSGASQARRFVTEARFHNGVIHGTY